MQQFTAFEDPTSTREYTTGQRGELYSVSGPSNIASNNRRAQARFVSFVPGLVAMSEVFQAANVVGHLTFDPARLPDSGVPTSITASNTLLVGENTAVNLLTEYLLGRNGVGVSDATSSQLSVLWLTRLLGLVRRSPCRISRSSYVIKSA